MQRKTVAIVTGTMLLAALYVRTVTLTAALPCTDPSDPRCTVTLASSSSAPKLCGNGHQDSGEECDDGKYNGATNCSLDCKLLYCGDGIVSPLLSEECEPSYQLVSVVDPVTQKTVTEKRFDAPVCGSYCTIPICSSNGKCVGGCKRRSLAPCAGDTSVPSSSAPSSAASVSSAAVSSSTSTAAAAQQSVMTQKTSSATTSSSLASSSTAPAPVSPAAMQVSSSVQGVPVPTTVNVVASPTCGDGNVDRGEQCDDGPRNSDTRPGACRTDCSLPHCGDGQVDKGEQCDDGPRNSDTRTDACRMDCTLSRCGDGVKDKGEQCDDGNAINDDTCTNTCRLPRCGDGVLQEGEQCDEGAKNSDTRANVCRKDCSLPYCGDGVKDKGEQCDGGDQNSDTQPGACRSTCTKAACGDGVVDPGEQCDDTNLIPGDGCSPQCQVEQAFVCAGSPSICSRAAASSSSAGPSCGNGVKELGEQCDKGDRNSDTSADACRSDCTLPRCGDGVKDRGEECDGGENCTQTCKLVSSLVVSLDQNKQQDTRGMILVVLSAVEAGLITLFLFRKSLLRFLGARPSKRPSLDDIPLSEIERPGK